MISFLKRVLPVFLLFIACKVENHITAEEIIKKSIEISGFNDDGITLEFDFREYHYELDRKGFYYSYARTKRKDGKEVRDVMSSNKGLKRFIDNVPKELSDSLAEVYSSSLNSVMYFFNSQNPFKMMQYAMN